MEESGDFGTLESEKFDSLFLNATGKNFERVALISILS